MHSQISNDCKIELPSELMYDLNLQPGDDIRFVKTAKGYMIMTTNKKQTTYEQRIKYAKLVLHESQNVIDRLTDISMVDDVYSQDEIYLCNVVHEKVFQFQEFLKKVMADDKVTENEYERIENFWREIQDEALKAANRDDKISFEEEALLDALNKIITDLH